MIAVVVRTADEPRLAEALRAAVGLGLRGDRVTVVLDGDAARAAESTSHPGIRRALATLPELGQTVTSSSAILPAVLRDADAVEVWT